MLSISVLGPTELWADGQRLVVPAGKTTEILIRLALDAGATVRSERLIEDLWGSEADGTARNTMQTKVSKLRRALGDAAILSGGRAGYCLGVEPSAVDALEVLSVAEEATAHLNERNLGRVLELCASALAMFRGEVLCDAGDGDWLIPHRVRLGEVRLGLLESQLAARVGLGAASEVVGELEAMVAQHPLRERLWALLITALYRDGRQADALAAYRRVREHLADELGLDPGPELQSLEQQVLLQDRALDLSSASAKTADLPVDRGNLPVLSSELVGRGAELVELSNLVSRHRLVTLVGPAGVGKTRLATEVGRLNGAGEGAWLVRLENARTPESLSLAIGESFGLPGVTEAMVFDRLRTSDALLVLDNCEHLIESASDFTARLLSAAPRLKVLATSQVPLGLDGEVVYVVEPLSPTDSVELFTQRAQARRKSFVLDPDSVAAIDEVCRSLDGLPLAIELAAARTKALSVQEIGRRLDDRFGLLNDPTSRRPERHRALATAIAWSYDLLFPDEQRGLWALACFAGSAPLAGVEHLLTALEVPVDAAVDVIDRLTDRSLVVIDVGPDASVRYRLLDSVRAFALDRLEESGMTNPAFSAHAAWFADLADGAAADQRGPNQARHLSLMSGERANIDAAIEWTAIHDPMVGLRVAIGFGWLSVILGEGAVGAERIRSAVVAAGDLATPEDRSVAYTLIGWNEAGADVVTAQFEAGHAVEIADSLGDHRLMGESRLALAFVLSQLGQPRAAIELLDAFRAGRDVAWDAWGEVMECVLIGYAGLPAGELDRVSDASEVAAKLVDEIGDEWLTSHVEAIVGLAAQADGRFSEAAAHLERAAEAARRGALPATEAFHLAHLGPVLQLAGDNDAAIAMLERAIDTALTVGLMRVVAIARVHLGRLLLGLGDTEAARVPLAAADEWYRASGGGEEAALAACSVAAIDAEAGVREAADRLTAVLGAAIDTDDVEVQVLALDSLAALRAKASDKTGAEVLLRRADDVMSASGFRVADADRRDARRARSLLGGS